MTITEVLLYAILTSGGKSDSERMASKMGPDIKVATKWVIPTGEIEIHLSSAPAVSSGTYLTSFISSKLPN